MIANTYQVAAVALLITLLAVSSASAQVISSEVNYTLRLRSNGTVAAWGTLNAKQAAGLESLPNDITAVAGGLSHGLALKSNGTVVAWGNETTPQVTVPPSVIDVKAIAAGARNSLALLSNGTVVAWGNNDNNQSTVPATVSGATAISAGAYHSLALLSDGTVQAWGDNEYSKVTGAAAITGATAIAAGGYHSLALLSDGKVAAWGDYRNGQTTVPAGLTTATAVDAGEYHSLALRSDGTVAAWGKNADGQVSGASNLENVIYVTAGDSHNHAVLSDGSVVGWGKSTGGQLLNADALDLPAVARWSSAANGDYLNSHRWAQEIPSTALSTAVFDQTGENYTVQFGNEAKAANLTVSAGDVTFLQNGNSYNVGGAINVTGSVTKLQFDGPMIANSVNNEGSIEIVNGGSLTVTDTLTSTGTLINHGTIAGAMSVTGVLSGNGRIDGKLTVANGGSLAPGASVGRLLVTDTTTFGPGGIFDFEINDALPGSDGGGWDVLQLTGALDFATNFATDPTNKFLVNISTLNAANQAGLADNFDPTQDYSWAFVTAGGGISGFDADYISINDDGFQNNTDGGSFWISQQGDDKLMLNFNASLSAVPEPSSLVVLSLCGLGWAGYRIRAKKHARIEVSEAADSQLTEIR